MLTSLVTGAAGFAGQHLVRELLRRGDRVVGGTLEGRLAEGGLLRADEAAEVRWVTFDVTDAGQVMAACQEVGPDRVYHLAGQSSVSRSFADALGTWDVNATGTLRLLCALREMARPVRVLVVSSAEVYGAVAEAEQPIDEDRHVRPTSPYGASKAAAELVARQFATWPILDVVVARSFNHIGPGQSSSFALASWAEQLSRIGRGEAEPVLRVGNLDVRRDLLDVRDAVRAYRTLLERGESGAVYNVCSGVSRKLSEVVEALVELSATDARIEVDSERLRPADIPELTGDGTRLRKLGWQPTISLRQSLSDLLAAAGSPAATQP